MAKEEILEKKISVQNILIASLAVIILGIAAVFVFNLSVNVRTGDNQINGVQIPYQIQTETFDSDGTTIINGQLFTIKECVNSGNMAGIGGSPTITCTTNWANQKILIVG